MQFAPHIHWLLKARPSVRLGVVALVIALLGSPAQAVERVVFKRDGRQQEVVGQLIVEAEDGGLMLQSADGAIWNIPPEELVEHTKDDVPFKPLTPAAMGKQLLKSLPEGFEVHTTQHYVIAYNTSKAYAQWCGGLFENLYRVFNNYWTRKGFKLTDPKFPLVAILFEDKASYEEFAKSELGAAGGSIIGYYSLGTNRMTLYDLTGVESLRAPDDRRGSTAQINLMLSRPEAERAVATVIHEATHQIAFNCGLQTRFADIPLWVSEGIAVYFETPDLNSAKGWRNTGAVNPVRLAGFREYAAKRPPGSLTTLIADDARFRDTKQAVDAYAEAWALNYFLIRQRPRQYHEYLHKLAEKKPLIWDTPEERLAEFKAAFGDPAALDAEMLKFIGKIH